MEDKRCASSAGLRLEIIMEYGKLNLKINEILKARGTSKNQVCKDLDIPRSNFNRYCRNEFQRIDAVLMCKLCWYFGISIDEIIEYIPSEK